MERGQDKHEVKQRMRWRSQYIYPTVPVCKIQHRAGIQWRADVIYARKICAAVVDLIVDLINFWKFGYVSKSIVVKSARH